MKNVTTILNNLTRKRKQSSSRDEQSNKYIRCLSTLDLAGLGIASTIGIAVYILIGKLARDVAGPSVVLSLALAGLSSLLSGLCYAEFGCRIPKAGSAYSYTYLVLGELWAFIAGWNMILEYIIAISALGRACSEYINSLSGGIIYGFFIENLSWWDSPALAKFPDFMALLVVILMALVVGLGVRQSSTFNNMVTFLNIAVIIFALCCGSYYADTRNWSSWEKFAPYGFQGIITAAGSCFYAFAGFDVIGTAAEETINPKKAIPKAILLTITASFLSYFGISTVLTLMQPYYKLEEFAPLAGAFSQRGFLAGMYIIDIGAVASILTSLLALSFATPRLIHAIAADGLLFSWLDHINSTTHIPIRALACSSIIAGVLAVILNLQQLVEMFSIGTLTAYTLVAVSVLLTRYQCDVKSIYDDTTQEEEEEEEEEEEGRTKKAIVWIKSLLFKENEQESIKKHKTKYIKLTTSETKDEEASPTESETNRDGPTERSSFHASLATFILSMALGIFCIMVSSAHNELRLLKPWAISLTFASGVIVLAVIVFLHKLPRNSATFPFTVPFVPALPIMALFINILLIVNLNRWTYVRFIVWIVLGCFIYGFFGFENSKEALNYKSPIGTDEENE